MKTVRLCQLNQRMLKLFGIRGWFDSEGVGDRISHLVCEQTYIQARVCRAHYNFYFGPNRDNFELVSFFSKCQICKNKKN